MSKHIGFIEASTSGAGRVANKMAKERDCFVTLFTRNRASYSSSILEYVDRIVDCETNDADLLAEKVLEIAKEHTIDGVTTTADFYVPQAARAAQEIGLPSLTYKAASEVRNKYKMRLNLERTCPELNPLFRLVQTLDEARDVARQWGYPFIAKPQDGNDSLNVKLIRNESQLLAYMQQASSWDKNSAGQSYAKGVLLEGYIDGLLDSGREPSIETMQSKGGAIQLIGTTEKVLAGYERGHFAEVGACFSMHANVTDTLFAAVKKALSSLDIDCGVIHTELRFQNGQPKILEINPRLIGDKMGSHAIELALGISPVRALIDIALGDAEPWTPTREGGAAIQGICMPKPGRFLGIENLAEIKEMSGVAYVESNAKPGEFFDLPSSNADVLAQVITKGDTAEEALEFASRAVKAAKVIISD